MEILLTAAVAEQLVTNSFEYFFLLLNNTMAESETPKDATQQATTPTPKTKPENNPKRVAAGKATAQKLSSPTRRKKEPLKRRLL